MNQLLSFCKSVTLLIYLFAFVGEVYSQELEPVNWHISVKKIDKRKYEVQVNATIAAPWHIYSQENNEEATLPTKFQFGPNEVIEIPAKPREVGKLIEEDDPVLGEKLKFYENKVGFVYTVLLKSDNNVNHTCRISYMACSGQRCLPPKQVQLNIKLD
jgi:hypothetical protein